MEKTFSEIASEQAGKLREAYLGLVDAALETLMSKGAKPGNFIWLGAHVIIDSESGFGFRFSVKLEEYNATALGTPVMFVHDKNGWREVTGEAK